MKNHLIWRTFFLYVALFSSPADIPFVPGEAGVRDASDEDHKVHGERHLHALQLWGQPEGGVPPPQALQDGARGGSQQQGRANQIARHSKVCP